MIASLLVAFVLPVKIACTNCNGVGFVDLPCARCAGAGLVDPPKSTKFTRGAFERWLNGKIPCPVCVRGLSSKGKKGTGKVRRTCPVCKGLKKIKVKNSSSGDLTADTKK